MSVSQPDIRTAAELLEHMQKSQADYIANRAIERRRVRLRGVPGWYWLVVHLAYPEVGRRALAVPSQNSIGEKIVGPLTSPIRMLRFAVPATEILQRRITEISDKIKKKGQKQNEFITEQIKSANGYTVGGTGADGSIAFQYPGTIETNYFAYGLVVGGKAKFVLSTVQLGAGTAAPEESRILFAALSGGVANVQSTRVFDQEPDDSKQQIRDYLRSALPLPTDLNRNHA
jgi:hypothetical protein